MPLKIERLCTLAREAELLVACDSEKNARDLSLAASAQGVHIGVVIEQETGAGPLWCPGDRIGSGSSPID